MKTKIISGAVVAIIIVIILGIFIISTNKEDEEGENNTETTSEIKTETSENSESQEDIVIEYKDADYTGNYTIDDTGFGTKVSVTVDEDSNTRYITSNALPNHETGEFPNPGNPNTISEQEKTWEFTTIPTYTGNRTTSRDPGVAINGIKMQPGTAETITCDTGERYNVEALQDVYSLGTDFADAHVQPTGEYHYHGITNTLVDTVNTNPDQDLVHVGFAEDGHLIYYSKSDAYTSGYALGGGEREGTGCLYTGGGPGNTTGVDFGFIKDGALTQDWEYSEENGNLDECNGTKVDGEYAYFVTDTFPYISRCMMGEVPNSNQGGAGMPPR